MDPNQMQNLIYLTCGIAAGAIVTAFFLGQALLDMQAHNRRQSKTITDLHKESTWLRERLFNFREKTTLINLDK